VRQKYREKVFRQEGLANGSPPEGKLSRKNGGKGRLLSGPKNAALSPNTGGLQKKTTKWEGINHKFC